jgi:hypothetical protein
MDFMKAALQKKMQGFKDKKHMIHDGDSMHEGGENGDHPDLHSLHEHEKSGSDLAPPIVHGKRAGAEHDDELMAEHDMIQSGEPNEHEVDNMGVNTDGNHPAEHEQAESDKLDKILKALGGHGGSHAGRGAGSLRERVADKAKERFASISKERKY